MADTVKGEAAQTGGMNDRLQGLSEGQRAIVERVADETARNAERSSEAWICEECRKPWEAVGDQCSTCGNRTRVPVPDFGGVLKGILDAKPVHDGPPYTHVILPPEPDDDDEEA